MSATMDGLAEHQPDDTTPEGPAIEAEPQAAPAQPAIPLPSQMGRAKATDSPAADRTPALLAAEKFGRVDPDGNIFVALPDGNEHFVGQWAAGDPAEGLRFYAIKYDDLVVDVDLAGRRLNERKMSPADAERTIERVRTALLDPKCVGDLAGLAERVHQLETIVTLRRETIGEERAAAREEAAQKRQAIVDEAQKLAKSKDWRRANDRFRQLVEDWKAIPRTDRSSEQEQWKAFSASRSAFDKARRAHHTAQEREHAKAKAAKQALIKEADALADSTDWIGTARAYRELMDRWKTAGFAGKPTDDVLWRKFRAAQDRFFEARKAALGERDAEQGANLERKRAIVVRAEALLPITDIKTARREYRKLLAEFAEIGHVPRPDKPKLDNRLSKVDDAIKSAEQDQWRKADPEKNARAQSMVSLYERSVAKIEQQLQAARAAGHDTAELELDLTAQRELLDTARKYA